MTGLPGNPDIGAKLNGVSGIPHMSYAALPNCD